MSYKSGFLNEEQVNTLFGEEGGNRIWELITDEKDELISDEVLKIFAIIYLGDELQIDIFNSHFKTKDIQKWKKTWSYMYRLSMPLIIRVALESHQKNCLVLDYLYELASDCEKDQVELQLNIFKSAAENFFMPSDIRALCINYRQDSSTILNNHPILECTCHEVMHKPTPLSMDQELV